MKPAFENILDDCICLLKQGQSVSYCLEKYPHVHGLEAALLVAQSLHRLPIKQPALRKAVVWDRVISTISKPATEKSFRFPFGRLALPRTTYVIVTLVLVGALLDSTAVAAQNSLPGETLYPVKRTVEKIQLTLAFDEAQKASVRLQHAQNRLAEAQTIVEQNPQPNPDTIKQTLTELSDTTSQVAADSTNNKDILQKVVQITDTQQTVLTAIENKTPDDTAKQAISQALDSALETKAVAQLSLAKLEDGNATSTSPTATSTAPDVKGATTKSTTTDPTVKPVTPPSSTSTDDTLKALGSPDGTTTDPVLLDITTSTSVTTTQIINLKP